MEVFKVKSEFWKNVFRLANSSVLTILISLLTLPVITRLYDPSVFGEFQIFLSTIGILSVVSSFKYEMAIVLPKNRIEANAVFTLSLLLLILTTGVFAVLFYFLGSWFLAFINAEVLEPYIALLVISIFLSGLVQIAGYVLTREKKFHKLSNNQIIEVFTTQSLKVGLGMASPTFMGLFISQIVGYILNIYLTMKTTGISFMFSGKKIRIVFHKYIKFLLYSTPAIFVNTVALQLPIFFIAKYFGAEFLGYYVFAVKLIDIPLGIAGNAISQVYYKEAIDQFHQSIQHLFTLYRNTMKKLIFFMIIPSIIIYFLAEPLIPYILGSKWSVTGEIMSVLIIWKLFEFVNAPISTTLMILNQQNIDLYLKIFLSFGFRFIVLLIFNDSFMEMIYAISISAAIYYSTYNLITYLILRRKNGL